ncbi:hypothetical protein DQW50_08185 [Halorubrum sp. 48-1-W]|uniref:DUF7117 family protein n=1 Tax=Halorubrum sp. 48-1-W TaxID=2249761 RepID=UPI000DCCB463|nr:hypothetical protein [Halorubrum sp. 48-1-W]RAW45522.1 hypothetical protein DQW50_08185 [Halorubrum sp. 48-1-W]
MKIRGERKCHDCGNRWSYFETGTVECPDCGSLRSVGTTARATHTDSPVTLELSPHRDRFGEARGTLPTEGIDDLKRDLREYVHKRGFIHSGELRDLDSTYLAARELIEAVDVYDRLRNPTDADREYLLALLAGADDGDRPDTTVVPEAMREARGMAAVRSVDEYRADLSTFLEELADLREPAGGKGEGAVSVRDVGVGVDAERNGERDANVEDADVDVAVDDVDVDAVDDVDVDAVDDVDVDRVAPAREALERLRDRIRRVEALQGDVEPATADALVAAANALGDYVRSGTTASLERARDRIDESEP